MSKAAALHIARHIQAGNHIAVCIEGVAVFIRFQTTANYQQKCAFKLVCIVWRSLHREHTARNFAKVIIGMFSGKVIIAADGSQRRFLGCFIIRVHLLNQFCKRIRHDSTTVCHSSIQLILALVVSVRSVVGRALFLTGVILYIAGTAVYCRHIWQLILPVTVENLPALLILQKLNLVFNLLSGKIFIHESLAVHVKVQETSNTHNADACKIRTAAHVVNHRCMIHLDFCACPHTELNTVAHICHLTLHIHIGEEAHDAFFNHVRTEMFDHCLILRIVTRCENNTLFRHSLDILSGLGIAEIGTDATAIFHNELLCKVSVSLLNVPGGNCSFHILIQVHGLVGKEFNRCRIARESFFCPVVILG